MKGYFRSWATVSCLLLLVLSLTACSAATKTATLLTAASGNPTPIANFTPGATPDYQPFSALMAKVSHVGPLYVTGTSLVRDTALDAAGTTVAAMLRNRSDLSDILRSKGAIVAVFAHDETACNVVYITDGIDCKTYTGGWSATAALPVTGCSERNLLKEPDDPFDRGTLPDGSNNCVHQLAKTILRLALTDNDRAAVQTRFAAIQQSGLWSGDYATADYEEFFAEMSQCYFSANVAVARPMHSRGINGPEALKKYDPATYALLDGIYRGATDLR